MWLGKKTGEQLGQGSANGSRSVPHNNVSYGAQQSAHIIIEYMDRLTGFGLFAVSSMLICYALENRSAWFTLAFAGSCVLAAIYGFLQGAWPFGLVEAAWSVVAVRRWWLKMSDLESVRCRQDGTSIPS